MIKSKRYSVISIHPETGGCNLNCFFCYKKDKVITKETKDKKFWIDLMKSASKLTNQIACGANGEPFMDVGFIKDLAAEAKKQGLLFNVTSNGRLLMQMADGELQDTLKDITMVSLSYDDFKVPDKLAQQNYLNLVSRIKTLTNVQVGSNLLINQKMFEKGGRGLIDTVDLLFRQGVDRVFALYPKNMPNSPDILKFKHIYQLLTLKYKSFYVDDLSRMIIQEERYSDWGNACHFGKDLISINEKGLITACSFCPDNEALLKLEKPSDLIKITKVKVCERFNCPYLIKP